MSARIHAARRRDLGIEQATGERVIAQLVKANLAPAEGTGWHRHEAKPCAVPDPQGW